MLIAVRLARGQRAAIEEEDAKRPNREREKLVGDRTRIVNRMRATLVRLGIRGFNPTLPKAEDKLAALRTAEDAPLPENTLADWLDFSPDVRKPI